MFPVFILFGKTISMYAVMSIIGLLVGGFLFCKSIKKAGGDDNEAIIFLLVLSLGMLVGGHALFGIINIKYFYLLFETSSLKDFIETISYLFGGMVFYGGLIGAFVFGLLYAKIRRLNTSLYMDYSAFFAPLFHSFARIGCFLGGCCYGIESKFGFSVSSNTITNIGNVKRFPVQLLESVLNFLIFFVIYLLVKKGALKGRAFYLYLAVYSTIRFFDEFLRGDEIRGFIFHISTSQFISILIELFAVVMLIVTAKKKRPSSE